MLVVFLLAGACSNFLLDPDIDPGRDPVRDTSGAQSPDADPDPDALALVISSSAAPIGNVSPVSVSFSFSQAVQGFDVGDISVVETSGAASIGSFSGSGAEYAADLSFTGEGEVTVLVDPGAATDAATGLVDSQAHSLTLVHDATAPAAVIEAPFSDGFEAGYETVVYGVDFTEDVSDFDVSDIEVTNGTAADFSGSGKNYSFSVTPDSDGAVSITVPAGAGHDAAGNASLADSFDYTYNSSLVAVNTSSASGEVTDDSSVTLTISFDLAMDGADPFELSDIAVTNGTADSLTDSSGGAETDYELIVSPVSEGTVEITIPQGASETTGARENMESVYSFYYDPDAPAVPSFSLTENTSGDPVGSNDFADDILKLEMDASGYRSADSGHSSGESLLTLEYTTDDGASWQSFDSGTAFLSAETTYAGINVRATDEVGNATEGSIISNVTIITMAPDAPLVAIDTAPVNATNYQAFSFSLTGGEPDYDYEYVIRDEGGSEVRSGTGTLDAGGNATVGGLDLGAVPAVPDGTVSVRARQTDPAGNESGWGQAATAKDVLVPAAPTVTILSADPVTSNGGANESFAFDITGGEGGNTYAYTGSTDGGGTPVAGGGTLDGSGEVQLSGINLLTLRDGTLTVSVTQTDAVGNTSAAGSDSVTLDATVLNEPEFTETVDPANETSYSFDLVGDPNADYTYSISSTSGGSAPGDSGTGTLDGSGRETVGPLDLSGLGDGYLILTVTMTDTVGNSATTTRVVAKEATVADTGIADFSSEPEAVTFDLTNHNTQNVYDGADPVKYDTDQAIGSDFDDVFAFSALVAGETFILDGGSGFNTIELGNYTGDRIEIESNDFTTPKLADNRSGTITVDLDGDGTGDATINFTNFENFLFNGRIFDGTPHAVRFDYPDNGGAYFRFFNSSEMDLRVQPAGNTEYGADSQSKKAVAVVSYNGSLDSDYEAVGIFNARDYGSNRYNGDSGWSNAGLLFDYADAGSFKFVTLQVNNSRWEIGGTSLTPQYAADTALAEDTNIRTEVRVSGTTAELFKGPDGSEVKVDGSNGERDFADALNDGQFGVRAISSWAEFSLQLAPSDWAPYAANYTELISQSAASDSLTIDVLADAVDNEGQDLSVVSISGGQGSLVDNGNGTVTYTIPSPSFYGVDEYTYVVSDGSNETEATIRIEVVP